MTDNNYTPPKFNADAFHCPYCNTYSHQIWHRIYLPDILGRTPLYDTYRKPYSTSICSKCKEAAIWDSIGKMLIPSTGTAPLPSANMPEDVKEIFEEARQVQPHSQRAAAALLRVALEKLTEHLGEINGTLYTRIRNLKEKGLHDTVIKSLHIVRITANEGGCHAGQIDLTGEDNQEIVDRLFFLVNLIVEKTITEPQIIDNCFNELPKNKKENIRDRDSESLLG